LFTQFEMSFSNANDVSAKWKEVCVKSATCALEPILHFFQFNNPSLFRMQCYLPEIAYLNWHGKAFLMMG